jgi:mono/diheme cytochrome c family protein
MRALAGVAVVLLLVSACNREESAAPSRKIILEQDRPFSTESLMRGARLFQEKCALCHGPEAQGHPDWRNRQVVAAPPLNGNGNEWMRRQQDMVAIIKYGAKRNGDQVMPAWQGRLTDKEILDIITWYQALWPADVYERWRKANAAPSAPHG